MRRASGAGRRSGTPSRPCKRSTRTRCTKAAPNDPFGPIARWSLYLSYYDAGARVVEFSNRRGLVEKGFFIDEGGSHFWGTFPHYVGEREGAPLLLFSDRDFGLYILRYDDDRRGDGDDDDDDDRGDDDDRRGGRDDD